MSLTPVPSDKAEDLLINARKLDEFVNGTALTTEDRLGNNKPTIAGIIADLDAQAVVTETGANRALAETAAGLAAGAARLYVDDAAGLAATAEGGYYSIPSGLNDEVAVIKRKVGGVAVDTGKRTPAVGAVAAVKAQLDTTLFPFESIDPLILNGDSVVFLDANKKIIGQVPDPKLTALDAVTLKHVVFETLASGNSGVPLLDAAGKVIANLETIEGAAAAAANAVSTAQPLGPYINTWATREIRMRLQKRSIAEAVQLVMSNVGDSYTQGPYFQSALAKALQDKYGLAGVGWVGFPWWGTASGTWSAGTQPLGIDGSIRPDLVTTVQIIGTWTCSYNVAANNTPSLGRITSNTPTDYVRFTVPAGHDAAQLFYAGDGTGVVQVSWDDGATYSANINLSTVGAANVALAGTPTIAATARIKVVSGSVALAGVDLRSAASGVRIHKLGGSGSTSAQWAGVNAATWAAQMLALGAHAHTVMFGTNDQGGSFPTSFFASNLGTIMGNIAAVLPSSDRLLAMPPENNRTTNPIPMTAYATVARQYAAANDVAFLDLQYFFGSPANFGAAYAFSSATRPWYGSDLVHPQTATGGRAISDAFYRLFTSL